jgi:DNA-directed RNA polymerase subunit RPC12/RpoP
MKIELTCAKCGSNHFNYPLRFTNTSVITCADCGHEVGTVAELQQKVMDELASHAPERKA